LQRLLFLLSGIKFSSENGHNNHSFNDFLFGNQIG